MDPPVGDGVDGKDGEEVAQQLGDQVERERQDKADRKQVEHERIQLEADRARMAAADVDRARAEVDGKRNITDKEKVKLDKFFFLNAADLQEKRLERMALR